VICPQSVKGIPVLQSIPHGRIRRTFFACLLHLPLSRFENKSPPERPLFPPIVHFPFPTPNDNVQVHSDAIVFNFQTHLSPLSLGALASHKTRIPPPRLNKSPSAVCLLAPFAYSIRPFRRAMSLMFQKECTSRQGLISTRTNIFPHTMEIHERVSSRICFSNPPPSPLFDCPPQNHVLPVTGHLAFTLSIYIPSSALIHAPRPLDLSLWPSPMLPTRRFPDHRGGCQIDLNKPPPPSWQGHLFLSCSSNLFLPAPSPTQYLPHGRTHAPASLVEKEEASRTQGQGFACFLLFFFRSAKSTTVDR